MENGDHDDDEICKMNEKRNESNKRWKVEMELSWKLNFFIAIALKMRTKRN